MMTRTQILFDPELHRKAKTKAAELGVSLGEYIRRLVARDVEGRSTRKADISEIAGIGNSGGSDIAKYKDEYIGEAVEHEYLRKTGRLEE